jgi:hypothetical protein
MKQQPTKIARTVTVQVALAAIGTMLLVHFLSPANAQVNRLPNSAPNPIVTPTPAFTVAAIEAKYASLGGSAGFMGAPTSLTIKAADGVGYYSHYQGGSIFYTSATGAKVVRGAIRSKYASLGSERSFLRYPTTDELSAPNSSGYFSQFQGGAIYWSPATGAHEVHGAILAKWQSLNLERGFLGYPLTDESATPDGIGRYNHFQGGSIYWTPSTGAHEVHGEIRQKWAKLGWELSTLGYPTSDETTTPDGVGRYNRFEKGAIYWTPATGAHAVRGAIYDKWASLGLERSSLGYPITDEITRSITGITISRANKFQRGGIRINVTGLVEVTGALWTDLRVQAILLRDDNGSNPVNITAAQITTWLNYANQVFAPNFIRFNFDPVADCATLNSTLLNQQDLPSHQKEANAEAAKYPGKIVVFFRARSGGNGYSWGPEEGTNFVAMPGFPDTGVCGHQNLAQLAHDLGHYLGLPHTFPRKFAFNTQEEAKAWLASMGHFDGDGFSDTPEDPTPVVAGGCGPTPVTVFFEGRTYTPPRTNVMSYYSDFQADFDRSPLVQKLTPQQFDRVYDVIKIRGLL